MEDPTGHDTDDVDDDEGDDDRGDAASAADTGSASDDAGSLTEHGESGSDSGDEEGTGDETGNGTTGEPPLEPATHFDETPLDWSVPRTHDGYAPAQRGTTFTAVTDIDGDGALDLVSTGRCLANGTGCTYTAWGDENDDAHWRLYTNTGDGFAASATDWAVPRTHDASAPAQLGTTFTAVVDLDGNGEADLVSTGRCLSNGTGCTYTAWGDESNDAHWRVYANTGAGFAASASEWQVPRTHSGAAPAQLGTTFTAVVDLEGDGGLELVSTGRCLANGTGCTYTAWGDEDDDAHWRVYANTGDGFASSPTEWPVPRTHDDFAPAQVAGTFTGLVDLDGDGAADLVSTGRCLSNGTGCTYTAWGDENDNAHWRAYLNTGDGFANAATDWPVPRTHDDYAPPQLAGTFTALVDMTSDGRPDLVSTGRCLSNGTGCTYTAWGDEDDAAHWRVYVNTGDGFSADADEWTVPRTHDDYAPAQLWGTFTSVVDLDDDGRIDLLSTGRCLSNGTGCTYTAWGDEEDDAHWRLYLGVP